MKALAYRGTLQQNTIFVKIMGHVKKLGIKQIELLVYNGKIYDR